MARVKHHSYIVSGTTSGITIGATKGFSMSMKGTAVMKTMATWYNDEIILDEPVDFVSVFPVKKIKGVKLQNFDRFEAEVKITDGAKPEITSFGNKPENNPYLLSTIYLSSEQIKRFSDIDMACLNIVAILAQTLNIDLDEARKMFYDDLENAEFIEIQTAIPLIEAVPLFHKFNTKREYAFFHLRVEGYASVTNNSNHQKSEGEFVDDFYLQNEIVTMLEPFRLAFERGDRFSLMLTGEAGYGKTTVGKAIAKHLKKEHLRVDCSVMLDTHAWFGTMQAKDGNTFFDPTEFTRVLEKGDCVIVLDEANRMNIEVANSLLPILDDSGEIRIRNTHIKAGKGILFLVTLNEGIEYTGIGGSLDKAFQSRVTAKVTVHPLPAQVELQVITKAYPTLELETIEKLVKIMNAFRDTVNRQRKEGNFITADVSTRVTKQIAWWLSLGLDFNLALRYALYNFITDDEKVLFSDTARLNGIQ